ncbi:MAG: GWxTD domain-containing protein [Ignavibacteria bacterium]|nr:GWxTD domain-containing protein [Ignavibacteria bacterium]
MKKVLVYLLFFIVPAISLSQVENVSRLAVRTVNPFFYYNALNFIDEDSSLTRIDLYIQVPYTQLTFIKDGNSFQSIYEISAGIYDQNDKIITEKIWSERITLASYSESISRGGSNISLRSFRLQPGTYKIKIYMEDRESKRNATANAELNVRDFRTYSFSVSDILLVKDYSEIAGTRRIIPNITNNIVFSDSGFYIFWEFYKQSEDSLYNVNCKIKNQDGQVILDFDTPYKFLTNKNPVFLKIQKQDFKLGEYVVTVSAISNNSNEGPYNVSKKIFSRWIGVPKSVVDLNKAIEQMIYITSRENIENMLSIKEEPERFNIFMDFWKSKDPTPSTADNELMDEYYGRIDYSTKNFSNYMEGWKTDMGMVFVILGPPNNVDRYPFNYDTPAHEVWEYYNLNRKFVFVDYSGFGDYRLLNRDYSEWFKYR